ncbi:XrtA/PEP-CTERM system-associated ATPase [Propionivibrio soli]|uniref:XrtA/PEP-CTERM system-associated ATPase n=1 Tax=Propionivibrio soli TaxID=2976531 RepID=UPI0021E92F6C|nr:XrtA/PEP-CTERM system-associated ATPase [Propionivibrio soli]
MYESFYGLTSKPFQLNPDPTFYFGSKQHRRATAYLEYGMHQNEGFIVVTGEVGAGKTTIVRGLLNKLNSAKVVAAQLVSTQLDAEDTLRMVAAAFGVRTRDLGKSDVLLALEAFLVDVTRQGKRCLLIVDEAQNLTPHAVEELRMLSNFQFETQALLQSFLIGQPEFRNIMQSPHMQQLRQRVIAACHIGPMDQDETRAYIEHRLKCAGYNGDPLFDEAAYAAVFASSGGVPRRINSLCDRILLSGFLGGKKQFGVADVEEISKELGEETLGPAYPARGIANTLGQPDMASRLTDSSLLDINLSRLELDAATADEASRAIDDLKHGITEQRMVRLERSMIRIERSSAATLALLQQLVNAIKVRQPEKEEKA